MPSSKQTTIEDDVDDLDDVLAKFNAPNASGSSSKPVKAPTTSTTAPESKTDEEINDEDFAEQFAAEMEAFMKGLVNPDGDKDEPLDPKVADQAEALRKAWEQLLVDDLEAMDLKTGEDDENTSSESKAPGKAKGKAKPDTKAKAGLGSSSQASTSQVEDEFQKAVRQAMEKLKESNDSNKADDANGDLADLLSAFSGLNFSKDGDDTENVQGVLEQLMGQLMSKEVLYEPLKELNDKFPGYLEENRGLIATDDQVRYDQQMSIVSQVIAIFEAPDYSDDNQAMTSEIISLVSEMQEYGSPPADIMGKLPPGFEVGSDGLPALDDKCIIS